MPFGATSSVYAWHRVGNLLAWLIMTQAKSPLGRYVDDFFGAARTDIRWTGGYLLDILCSCLGFLADPSKANDFRWVMDVLGVEAQLVWADKLIRLRVSTDKIRKWLEVLARILADRSRSSRYLSLMMASPTPLSLVTPMPRH